jgi:hypothetical protein
MDVKRMRNERGPGWGAQRYGAKSAKWDEVVPGIELGLPESESDVLTITLYNQVVGVFALKALYIIHRLPISHCTFSEVAIMPGGQNNLSVNDPNVLFLIHRKVARYVRLNLYPWLLPHREHWTWLFDVYRAVPTMGVEDKHVLCFAMVWSISHVALLSEHVFSTLPWLRVRSGRLTPEASTEYKVQDLNKGGFWLWCVRILFWLYQL